MPDQSEIETFDVVIIGGGINGCGTFRDLCLQGVRCLLLEREDFCAGASGASSRLMHGGLKYLETGQFRLVKEALTERNMLLATAPHYVTALECVVPVTSVWGGIGGAITRLFGARKALKDRGWLLTALGLTLYDLYGRRLRAMPAHRMVGRRGIQRLMPGLAPVIRGAGVYYEGQLTHAERLGLELVLDGLAACPQARAENHIELLGRTEDVLRYRRRGVERQVRARVIVNAGGAWIDKVNATLGVETRLMGGSRGSHLVVDNAALFSALGGRMVYFGTPDGRVNLAYPFGGRVLIGATDINQPDPDAAHCTEDEVAYLCAAVSQIFPDIPIRSDQIVHRFCGVRPLPAAQGAVGAVTRDHSIVRCGLPDASLPVYCLIGGKWTTFRAFSEEVAHRVLADLGVPRRVQTAGRAIGGGRDFPRNAAARTHLIQTLCGAGGVDAMRAEVLLQRFGTRAGAYVATLAGKGEARLESLPDYACEEIRFIAKTELVGTVDDIIHRRTLIAKMGHDCPALRAEIAALIAPDVAATA